MSDINITVNSGQSKRLLVAGTLPRKNIVVTGVGSESAKLQHKTVTVTENTIIDIVPDSGYNGLSKATVNINVPIKECSGNHVIEVDTLPTENIDKNALYFYNGVYYTNGTPFKEFTDLLRVSSGAVSSLKSTAAAAGIAYSVNMIPTKTTEGIMVSDLSTAYHAYYIEDEDKAYFYTVNGWVVASEPFNTTYVGTVNDTSEVTSDGIYALVKNEVAWEKYFPGTAIIEIDILPTENAIEGAVYQLNKKTLDDLIAVMDGRKQSFAALINGGFPGGLYRIPTKTSEGIIVSDNDNSYFYYIEDEKDIFVYGDMNETGTVEWHSISTIGNSPLSNNGEIDDISEAIADGYYYILGESSTFHRYNEDETGVIDIIIDGTSLIVLGTALGLQIILHTVQTKPTENILVTDTSNYIWHLYYVEDERRVYMYVDGEWDDFFNEEIAIIFNANEAGSSGIYAVVSDGWTDYISPTGTLIIEENGIYNIADKSSVMVEVPIPEGYIKPSGSITLTENGDHNISSYETAIVNVTVPSSYMVQSVAKLPADANDGSFAIVLGGE